ncbi:hypothetical protein GCM10027294_26610 [Marinactinospora endophytica]
MVVAGGGGGPGAVGVEVDEVGGGGHGVPFWGVSGVQDGGWWSVRAVRGGGSGRGWLLWVVGVTFTHLFS